MSRQWRSDDTSKWTHGFGNGSDGDLSLSTALSGIAGHGFATFTGTSGASSGTFTDAAYFNGSNGGRIGDIVIIHQTKGSGAGNYELNVITNRVGSTVYFKYPLQNTYVTGAQIVSSGQFNDINLSGTVTPYLSWNGSAGGILFLVAKGTLTITGTLNVKGNNGTTADPGIGGVGAGFKGGNGRRVDDKTGAYQGNSYINDGVLSTAKNNSSGGGGEESGGGGGGNGAAGTTATNGYGPNGVGGDACGNASLTSMFLGGSGGGGFVRDASSRTSGGGGAGGGIVFLIAKNIVTSGATGVTVNGGNGGTATYQRAGGGGGAGGSVLLKCVTATLGTNKITGAGGVGGTSADGAVGGNGGVGRIHLDYSKSYTGTTSPTIDARLDTTIKPSGAGNMLLAF